MSEQQPGPASAQSLAQAQAEVANGNTAAAGSLVRQAVGRDTNGIDAAVRSAILAEFPSSAGASSTVSEGAGQMP